MMIHIFVVFAIKAHAFLRETPDIVLHSTDGNRRGLHLILSRYNIGQTDLEHLVNARKKEFEYISKPSLRGQTDRRFYWILVTDAEAAEDLSKEFEGGDTWYQFVGYPHHYPHRKYTPLDILDQIFEKRDFKSFVESNQIDHLVITHLDIDDALPTDYISHISQWYQANSATWQSSQSAACSLRGLHWMPDPEALYGMTKVREENISRGCLATGIVIATHIDSILNETRSQITGVHISIRAKNPGIFYVIDRPILRVRSITSVGAKGLTERHRTMREDRDNHTIYTQPDFDLLMKEYNIAQANFLALNRHLVDAAPHLAREILRRRNARGCNKRFPGSCGANIPIACAVLNFEPPECRGLQGKSKRFATAEKKGSEFTMFRKRKRFNKNATEATPRNARGRQVITSDYHHHPTTTMKTRRTVRQFPSFSK